MGDVPEHLKRGNTCHKRAQEVFRQNDEQRQGVTYHGVIEDCLAIPDCYGVLFDILHSCMQRLSRQRSIVSSAMHSSTARVPILRTLRAAKRC